MTFQAVPRVLSVVVPVYFNEDSLLLLHEDLVRIDGRLRADHDVSLEIIYVDDGSRDSSREVLRQIKASWPSARIVFHTRNFGAVAATKTGFQHVTGDAFACIAADFQDPPDLLLQMVPAWLAGHKFVIAVRESRNDPWVSKAFSRVYHSMIRLFVIKDYPEGGFDLALMDKELLPPMRDSAKNSFTSLLAYWLGYEPFIVTYHRPERVGGVSRWTFGKKFKSFLDVMLGFSVTPIRVVSAFGGCVAAFSFLYGVSVLAGSMLGQIKVSGFASLAIMITFLLGLVLVMLGVIAEYLWRIFDEVNRRPDVVVDEVL